MPLDREQLLRKKAALKIEEVQVPEWGDSVFVRELSAAERDAFEAGTLLMNRKGQVQGVNLANMRARLLVYTICDKDGQRLLQDGDAEDLGMLGAAALQALYNAAQRLSGITAADMEELEKNSVSGPAGDFSLS